MENWIAKHLSGETTPAEETELQEWIAQNPANEKLYLDLKKVNQFGKQHYETRALLSQDIDLHQEWNQFLKNTGNQKDIKVVTLEPSTNRINNLFKFAAAILLLLGIGVVINYFTEKSATIVYQTTAKTEEVELPDGSIITLNKNSTISYSESFGVADRFVNLSGEAFFDVTKDKDKHFFIVTQKAQIEVLGTSFNVRADAKSEETEVVVSTGVVKLSTNETQEAITLNPGDKGIAMKGRVTGKVNENVNFLAWKTGKLVFEENQLDTVFETLSRIYQIDIITEPTIPPSCEVTVTFEKQSIESIFNVLKSTLDLEYVIDSTEIKITRVGC